MDIETRNDIIDRAYDIAGSSRFTHRQRRKILERIDGIGSSARIGQEMTLDDACLVFDSVLVMQGALFGIYFERGNR